MGLSCAVPNSCSIHGTLSEVPCLSLHAFMIEFEVNFSFCTELGSAKPSLSNLIDLPLNMTTCTLYPKTTYNDTCVKGECKQAFLTG